MSRMRAGFGGVLRLTPWLPLLLCACGIGTLALAALLRQPVLLQWRVPATMLVVALVVAAAALFAWYRLAGRPLRHQRWLLGLWLMVALVAGWQEAGFRRHKQNVLAAPRAIAQKLGAHIIVGYDDPVTVKMLAARGLVGGIFITAHNVRNRSKAAIDAEISMLQTLRKVAGLPPLIVTTDQEGGIVSRMSPPLEPMPPLADVIATAKPEEVERRAFAYGQQQGHELASLGVNVNFAPLADLSTASQHHRFDFRSLIGRRAIGDDPVRVSSAVIGYAHGLESAGVRATLKHFPGLGRVTGDTHVRPAVLTASQDELESSDWIPFQAGLRATQSLLMVGHATLSAVDDSRPASRSARVIQEIVRKRWHHDGVLVTDDLTMGAVVAQGLCPAGVEALNAGIDLLLVSYDVEQYYEIFDCLLQAERDNRLDRRMLAGSQQRLGRLLASFVRRPLYSWHASRDERQAML